MNFQFYNFTLHTGLALLGWEEHTFEGQKVWVHISGLVLYRQ